MWTPTCAAAAGAERNRMATPSPFGHDLFMRHRLLGLAENPGLPADLIERLVETADADMACALAERSDLTATQVALLAEFDAVAVKLIYEERLKTVDADDVAKRPRVALALLDVGIGWEDWGWRLARGSDVGVVAELALWAPTALAAELAAHPHADVRRGVAGNKATPPAALAALLTGAALASGETLPPARTCQVCERETIPFVHSRDCDRPDCDLPPDAACDGSHQSTQHWIQCSALENPATPADAAARFADHPSAFLRGALAGRADLSVQVMSVLAEDSIPWVRSTLAHNQAITEDVIRKLATDNGHDVQRALAEHPGISLEILEHLAGATRIGSRLLPRIAAASPEEVEQLAASPNPVMRMLLAHRRDLPAAVRDALVEDRDAKVAKAVAPHPGLSDAQLRAMLARHGAQVMAKVAANPDAAAELLEELACRQPPVHKALREIAVHPRATATALLACLDDGRARRLAARHPALPPSTIVELLDDEDWQVVEAAAANPSLPRAAMTRLLS